MASLQRGCPTHLYLAALRLLFGQPLASGRKEGGKGEKGLNPARGDQKIAETTAGSGGAGRGASVS